MTHRSGVSAVMTSPMNVTTAKSITDRIAPIRSMIQPPMSTMTMFGKL